MAAAEKARSLLGSNLLTLDLVKKILKPGIILKKVLCHLNVDQTIDCLQR